MREVALIGVGQLPFRARYVEYDYRELAFLATRNVLADAGISIGEVDSAVYGIYSDLLMRQQTSDCMIHDYLGLRGKPGLRVTSGASTGAYALRAAYCEVASGLSDIVLLLGVQKSADLINPESGHRGEGIMMSESITHDVIWQHRYTPMPPAAWGVILIAHMEKYGGPTPEQIAKVSVKNHRNALVNPNAQLKMELTVEEVLNSRIIAWPTTMYECCLFSEGAAAVILAEAEKAKALCDKPIWIRGVGTCHETAIPDMSEEAIGRTLAISGAARQAYRMAGITSPLEELDVAEVHDLYSGLEILAYEELGFCPLGEGGRLIDEGVVEKEGTLPVNPSGGRVACGHIAGPSEVYSLGEVALQLRGDAGQRQVKISRGKGLVQTVGGPGASLGAVVILER